MTEPQRVTRAGVEWMVTSPPPSAIVRFWEGAWERGWEQETLDIVDRFVTPESTFVDIGAWIGPVSMWAARLGARVVAVEPDPVARQCLVENCERNEYELVEMFPVIIAGEDGRASLEPYGGEYGSSMTRTGPGDDYPAWGLRTLFDVAWIENCALVKMDVEGHEANILPTAGPYLAELGVPLWVSMHEPWWPEPLAPTWADAFSSIEGDPTGWNSVLCLP